MRVITGTARGRKLKTLEGMDVRPTTDKVKEAIFSTVQFDIEGSTILDLFSGSGQMGIEALSRGAGYCFFVDAARASFDITKENLTATGLIANARVLNMDSIEYLKVAKYTYDIAILDPPYNKGIIEKALPLLVQKMNDGGKIICEHEVGLVLPECFGNFSIKKKYKYGKVEVTLYTQKNED